MIVTFGRVFWLFFVPIHPLPVPVPVFSAFSMKRKETNFC